MTHTEICSEYYGPQRKAVTNDDGPTFSTVDGKFVIPEESMVDEATPDAEDAGNRMEDDEDSGSTKRRRT